MLFVTEASDSTPKSLSDRLPPSVISLGYRLVFRKRRIPEGVFPIENLSGIGLEVGGPSLFFKHSFPVYRSAARVDGLNFAGVTMWEGSIREGDPFSCAGQEIGTQFLGEATSLSMFPEQSFDFVLSCHSLEHVANPLKALKEWRRVLRPGGYLVLVLPNKSANFDHRRPTTTMTHLLADFTAGVGEDDLTHLPEILALHDLERDRAAGTREAFAKRSESNFANRGLHHHIFDLDLLREAFRFLNLEEVAGHSSYYDHLIVGKA
jgi:SAM-dependent methyltransferase